MRSLNFNDGKGKFAQDFLANRNITGDVSNVLLLDLVTFTEKMVRCGHKGWTSTRRWAMVLVLRGSKYVKKSKKKRWRLIALHHHKPVSLVQGGRPPYFHVVYRKF